MFMTRQLIVVPSGVRPDVSSVCKVDVVQQVHLVDSEHCESVQLHTAFILKGMLLC